MENSNHNIQDLPLLRKRAQLLAKREDKQAEADRFIEVTEFMINGEKYAFESHHIKEVHQLRQYTPLPCTPDFIFGIMNIRSRIVSIVDIRLFFGFSKQVARGNEKVIILKNEISEMGILVDSIEGVSRINANTLEVGLPTITDLKAEYLLGIDKSCLVVLDAEKILRSEKIIISEEV